MRLVFLVALVANVIAGQAVAQNGAGVFGPRVTAGHRLAEYRYTLSEPGDDLSSPWIQRLHYEAALNETFMWRFIGQMRNPGDGAEFDNIKGELFVDLGQINNRWHTGMRFDAFLRNGDRPEQLGVHWTNQFTLTERSFVRLVALTTYQFGENGADTPRLSTRASYVRRFRDGWALSVEAYDQWGDFNALGQFDQRTHEIGPHLVIPVAGRWSVYLGGLWGISDAAPDTSFRSRLTYTY
ncbi:MAG: hypothetical protein AAFR65_07705 [Pseudomonadota bacterium]